LIRHPKGWSLPTGDALHAVLCAPGFNIRWLLRAIAAKEFKAFLFALSRWAPWPQWLASAPNFASIARATPAKLFAP
jgi:transposase, IS5 family